MSVKIFREIRIFSRDEKKQDDLRKKHNNEIIKFYIGDVRDYNSVEKACRGVDYIFHAAALKQVPSCEFFPLEATKTNVFGTMNVIQAAEANGVKVKLFFQGLLITLRAILNGKFHYKRRNI